MGRSEEMTRMQDELIRRSDAIKAINLIQNALFNSDIFPVTPQTRERHDVIQGILRHVWKVKEKLEKLSAVQPEPPWIPCSKKLPEMHEVNPVFNLLGIKKESERVQVSVKVGESQLVLFGWLRDGKWYGPDLSEFDDYQINYEVTAWMPLPDPYKGGEVSKNQDRSD